MVKLVDGWLGTLGGLTSDSPADQRRSMSVNVRGAARTWMEAARERRARVVVRNCIFGCWFVGLSRGWVVCWVGEVLVFVEE